MNSLLQKDGPENEGSTPSGAGVIPIFDDAVVSIIDDSPLDPEKEKEPFILSESPPLSSAETARAGGLAYSAALALFGAVLFMLLIGWGADLLLGTSPWGIVVGIVIGAAIGFIQFFRITGSIFKT